MNIILASENEIEFNTCGICGANNGRAGMLIGNEKLGEVMACLNCHDTRKTNSIVIHSNLSRTDEELQKTFQILNNNQGKN